MLKLPSISKKVRCLLSPTASRSDMRKHFWQVTRRGEGGVSIPRKEGLNWTIPALVKRRVGSSRGTREELGMTLCPLPSKKARKERRISSLSTLSDFIPDSEGCQRDQIGDIIFGHVEEP